MIRILAAVLCVNFFLLSPMASAYGPRLGEWESSGAPTEPYIPKAPVNYQCTIEVSIYQDARSFVGRVTHEFKTADFMESGTASYTISDKEDWKIYPNLKPRDIKALKRLVPGQSISLGFAPNGDGSEVVDMRVYARMVLHGETLSSSAASYESRATGVIYGEANVAKKANGPLVSFSLNVSAQCEEKR